MAIADLKLSELFSSSLTSTPAVSIQKENKVWVATGMLVHYLESFTDSLVVTDTKEQPMGVLGGMDIMDNVSENPTPELFDEKTVESIMSKDLAVMSPDSSLGELMEKWQQTRRAFCILPNALGGYSSISARKLLEIGANCKTDVTISDLPKKETISFEYGDTLGHIICLMMDNKTRKLVLSGSSEFISDRTVIQTIVQDLDYLRDTDNFLDLRFEKSFQLEHLKHVPENIGLKELSRTMFGMVHPYVFAKDQVYSPWDVCLALLSDDVNLERG